MSDEKSVFENFGCENVGYEKNVCTKVLCLIKLCQNEHKFGYEKFMPKKIWLGKKMWYKNFGYEKMWVRKFWVRKKYAIKNWDTFFFGTNKLCC